MDREKRVGRGQAKFLTAFEKGSPVPARGDWPGVPALERWLRRPSFREQYESLKRAMEEEVTMHVLGALLLKARRMTEILRRAAENEGGIPDGLEPELKECVKALEPWAKKFPGREPRPREVVESEKAMTFEEAAVRLAHPDAPREEVIEFFRKRAADEEEEPDDAEE